MRTLRQAAVLIVSALLLSPQAPAQSSSSSAGRRAAAHPEAKRARKAAERGDKAEAAGRIEQALEAYEEAARYGPQDTRIVEHAAALRSRLVRTYVDAAESNALAGHFDLATEALGAALAIDPTNSLITERLGQLKSMEQEPVAKTASEIEGLPKLQPQAGTRNVNLRGDTRTVYEQLASLFGVKASFDPDLNVRNVNMRVDNVDFKTAVSVLAAQTGTFWRPLNANSIFVAADTQEKRRQYALQAVQTFPLSAAVGPEEVTEILRILRDITAGTRIDLDSRSRTITMRDTPEKLALAGALIEQLERARGEVMLEIELLEVSRNAAQKLGIEAPSKAQLFTIPPNLLSQLANANNLSALQTLLAGIFGGSANGGASSISSLVPPLIAVGGGKTTFLLTLPGSAADFSNGLSLVHSGRQVLMRAQDGKPATFFVGDRFPVTLSLLSGSLGTSGFTPNPGGASNPFPLTSYEAGAGPVALVAADLENNGLLDLAAVNAIDNSISVYLNQSSSQGTFVQATGSPVPIGPKRVAAPAIRPAIASAVLTSSGCHDLLATDPLADTVNVLISKCDGTFVTPATISVGHNPSAIVTGDFNNDGNQDFAVSNEADDTISVFFGDGNGGFKPVPGSPFRVTKGLAINTTSLPAAIVNAAYSASLQSAGGNGAVTWSVVSGSLPAGITLDTTTGALTGTPAAAGNSSFTVQVKDSSTPLESATTLLNIPVSVAAPALAITTDSLANGSVGTPYDRILTAAGGTAPYTWSILPGSGSLPAGLSLAATTGEITGSPTTPGSFTFTVQVTDSSSTPLTAVKQFTLTPFSAAEQGPVAMVVADFNADGKQDLAVVNQTTTNLTILLGNGNGTFAEAAGSPITVGKLPVAVASGDLTGNAKADLAVVNQTDATVTILLNNGDGTFNAGPNSPLATASTPTGIAIADFNQDGHADIAVTNGGANTFRVFLGVSAGLLESAFEPSAGPTGTVPTAIIAANLVNGGFPDVAIANDLSGGAGDVSVVLSPANLFSSLGNSSAVQQPYPGSEYIDLGVKIKATPSLHPNNEVTLQLEFEIRALSGSSVNGIPILSNRTLSQTVRVKEDEPTLIGGLTDQEETRSITGLPGFAEIPGAGYAFGARNNTRQDTDLLIVVTPHRLRLVDHLTRSIYAGRGEPGGRGFVGPGRENLAPQPPPQQQLPPQPPQPQPLPQPQQQPQQQPQPQQRL